MLEVLSYYMLRKIKIKYLKIRLFFHKRKYLWIIGFKDLVFIKNKRKFLELKQKNY